jgi:hypothetical protein
VDVRWNAGNAGLSQTYAAQLIGLMPDVILVASTTNLTAIRQATSTVPVWEDRGQRMAGRQRRELFAAADVEDTGADQDRTNALLRQSCEGRFEIAVGSSIHNNELQAQRARRRLQV